MLAIEFNSVIGQRTTSLSQSVTNQARSLVVVKTAEDADGKATYSV